MIPLFVKKANLKAKPEHWAKMRDWLKSNVPELKNHSFSSAKEIEALLNKHHKGGVEGFLENEKPIQYDLAMMLKFHPELAELYEVVKGTELKHLFEIYLEKGDVENAEKIGEGAKKLK